ncbi:MAG TPA: capsule assembly Wzi family protein [Terriglobales bacterium]|nr:capsule assembly Wzi family protein [Terriglobales bacterium]
MNALNGWAQTGADTAKRQPDQQPDSESLAPTKGPKGDARPRLVEAGPAPENKLLLPFLKHITDDQRQFWSSLKELRKPAALETFLPFAGFTGALIAGDRWIAKQVPANQARRSRDISNYAVFSLVGAAAGSYAAGHWARNEHLRETGFLSGEAALNGTLITYAFKETTMRQRPYEGNGSGAFLQGGSSFPSEHAAIAWSVASIVAHEYPGSLTKLIAYGLASTVTLTRVTGKQHFPSDAVVGSALGWYLGRQIYRAHHDPELGGASWDNLRDDTEKAPRPPGSMGSPYVSLDSWVYPALEKLAAFGYIETAFIGLKPWTRMECAHLVEQAGDAAQRSEDSEGDLADLQSRLREEFAYEFGRFDGQPNATASIESVYTRGVSVSGPGLTDSDHFGQTLSYDFGRPFRTGTNAQFGGSFRAAIGPAAIFVRAEFQHAPSAPVLSEGIRNFIATSDLVPVPAATPFAPINRMRLLDAYIAMNVKEGWQLSFGKQSLSWGPGPGGSFLWSDNIEPIPMLRLTQSNTRLPGFLRILGPARVDSFLGRLEGHNYIPQPSIYGNKINFKPLPNLEFGFGRSVTIGGKGGTPLTTKNFFLSFFGQTNSQLNDVPGDSHSSFDWTFYLPKVHNYLVFYGDLYADDDFVPFQNPPKNPFRPGIYLTRFPLLPRLDFHMETASTESPGWANRGNLNYWNSTYRDGYTNHGNLIGNTAGRMGRAIQFWFTYWISPKNTVQFNYKHNTVSPDFVPQGGAWQDYSLRHEVYLHSGLYVKSQLQYEHISRYPLLFSEPQRNLTAVVELGFVPHKPK